MLFLREFATSNPRNNPKSPNIQTPLDAGMALPRGIGTDFSERTTPVRHIARFCAL
jgi:hypothetical protein